MERTWWQPRCSNPGVMQECPTCGNKKWHAERRNLREFHFEHTWYEFESAILRLAHRVGVACFWCGEPAELEGAFVVPMFKPTRFNPEPLACDILNIWSERKRDPDLPLHMTRSGIMLCDPGIHKLADDASYEARQLWWRLNETERLIGGSCEMCGYMALKLRRRFERRHKWVPDLYGWQRDSKRAVYYDSWIVQQMVEERRPRRRSAKHVQPSP